MEDESTANNSTHRSGTASQIPCTVCGVPSRGMVYGAIACEACKVFFRRNSPRGLHVFQCHFDGHCEININTRHLCAFCRLAKCFAKGMQAELLRCPRSTTKRNNQKRKVPDDEVQMVSIVSRRTNNSTQISTLNLLRTDQSPLTLDQWNLLSNLSHCYDDHAGLAIGERYMSDQNNLPHKLRFKSASIIQLFQKTLDGAQSLYQNNRDFLSLSTDDRSILLHNTLSHVASISANFIVYKVQLLNHPSYYDTIQMMGPPILVSVAQRFSQRINFDMVVMKLFLAILSFSTFRYTVYPNTSSANFSNIQQILCIQDTYTQMTWRYLVYKYGHEQAVKYFCDFIGCVFIMNEGIMASFDFQWFTDKVDSMIEDTDRSLSLVS